MPDVTISQDRHPLVGYLRYPRGDGPWPGVGHSFMNDWRHAPLRLRVFEYVNGFKYSEPEAEDAWDRITAFFHDHLGAP
ncbi:hypothetical protein CIW49_21440 [Mycolicibacterium sp. P1-18]|uniref:hypothetical protein n=1 Tax=Mycolicibacterium sp. P1-18 TaxID=2024615 RepID=UPI0011F26848|nr:hypothetical protein [Mycolicibacterium sp. P1-18]KAA0096087.1 hypothetical protein CIW49_21440 [Mycolicibacterium sp. P1-18]